MPIDYPYPIVRIGNEKNPKLIILLENPNSNSLHIKLNPEYTMSLDGVFSSRGMPISVVKEYDIWWYQLSKVWEKFLKDDDILALEYYPYATREDKKLKDKEIYPGKKDNEWNQFALSAFEENRNLLVQYIHLKTPIFVYYKSQWMDKVKELNLCENDKIAFGSSMNQYVNRKRLSVFLSKINF